MEDERENLIRKSNKSFNRCISNPRDELCNFRSCLQWMCVDQSNIWRACLSWSLFLLLAIVVPLVSHFVLACPNCDARHHRPYDSVVQVSLTVVASLSFVCLSNFVRKYGLRRFLFLDKLCEESDKVGLGYTEQLNRSLKLLLVFVLPCFVAESAYKIWWYSSGASRIPFLGNEVVSDVVACTMELCSWLYRTSIIFLVCVLFRLLCYLQILRLEDFAEVFQMECEVESVLKEHLRIRRHLRIISHRFRAFIVFALLCITASQLASLLILTRSNSVINIFTTGELSLCSITLVTGLFICLRSATKITHKAQSVTSLAAKWHVCATIESFDGGTDGERPVLAHQLARPHVCDFPINANGEWEDEETADGDDELDNTNFIILPIYARTISFHKRQALVTYFENNRAGVTVYGFMLDRSWLHTIFGIELSLILWLLSKTIVIKARGMERIQSYGIVFIETQNLLLWCTTASDGSIVGVAKEFC
ncbi:hypothetical protein NE237_032149 [Protea cynaroides]|uniref:Uncharacterized protein n=1 Tax=Protea cynaroides TaxID=273540 RepID=A0A9Q0R367_9MAGN|nr:hypothetical protein NE237_032149 [Protea cynaroides]